ncbi:MAG: peptide chain release factor 1 [Sorangiineae bacterium NIC37A_2]|jgi:peptide chain release factor 1|nr:MAG: peptide chain release factor 1 [Sorangiineae bacterium NIC37A_2]
MIPVDTLTQFSRRLEEVSELLCDPAVLADPRRQSELNREHRRLAPIAEAFKAYTKVEKQIAEDKSVLDDPELGPLVREELPALEADRDRLEREIRILLLPRDPDDDKNTVLEIRAGTGGEEAALFAADLFRMYARYAETKGWKVEILSQSEATAGGIKEIIALISGDNVYSVLKYESGVHRVQRVPATETQGRVHTSTATVAVLPEADEVDIELEDKDLRFDIAAASGPGGQGVNTTNSAVQVTHLPTGLSVRCMDERSQLKNKAKALKILRSRLLDAERTRQAEAIRDERRSQVKAGDRSEKIRTYNFPQNRLTDHRIGLTLYKLDRVMTGDLDELTEAIVTHYQAEALAADQTKS